MKTKELAVSVIEALREKAMTLSTAESCTGGGIGFVLTAVPGSSAVYSGGVVSYSNDVKSQLLKVQSETLRQFGAVSEPTARAMAEGVRMLIGTDLAVSVTGIAGPASDDTRKPVGLVYIAVSSGNKTVVQEYIFTGGRDEVREQTIQAALKLLLKELNAFES